MNIHISEFPVIVCFYQLSTLFCFVNFSMRFMCYCWLKLQVLSFDGRPFTQIGQIASDVETLPLKYPIACNNCCCLATRMCHLPATSHPTAAVCPAPFVNRLPKHLDTKMQNCFASMTQNRKCSLIWITITITIRWRKQLGTLASICSCGICFPFMHFTYLEQLK